MDIQEVWEFMKSKELSIVEAVETLIDTGKLTKLSKLDEIDGLKTKVKDLESKISEQNKTISEFIKPEDLEQKIKTLYDNISKHHSVYCYLLSSKKMWFLYLFITAVLSVGTTFLVMNTSSKEWAHRALIAAIDMNHQDPIDQYLTCRTEIPKDRKGYKAMQQSAVSLDQKTFKCTISTLRTTRCLR